MAKAKAAKQSNPKADTMDARLERAGLRDEDDGSYGQVRMLALGGGRKAPNQSELQDPFQRAGLYALRGRQRLLTPPLGLGSLEALVSITNESDILPQCISAFENNIDGFGHRLEPIDEEMKDATTWTPEAKAESEMLESFFTHCWDKGSFIKLRKVTRNDRETTGCAYWEVVQDLTGAIVALNHAPAHTMRMTAEDSEIVVVDELRRVGDQMVTVKVPRRFRSFCQIVKRGKDKLVWFKEFGDPRHMDLDSGEYYKTSRGVKEANAVIAFPVRYFALSPYSLPRWIGNLPAVLGSKGADEVNLLTLDNGSIPPLAVLVSGGMLTRNSVKRLEALFAERQGRENFHKVMLLEVAPPKDDGSQPQGTRPPRIEMQPMTDQMIRDAMFLNYTENNRNRSRSAFGLSPVFTGETIDMNRANAENARLVVEEQIFRPERHDFDFWMNRRFLPALGTAQGITHWRFASNGPNITLNEDLISLLTGGDAHGGMTPNLARVIMADILERPIPAIDEEWGDLPFAMTMAAMAPAPIIMGPGGTGEPGQEQEEPEKAARIMAQLAKRLPREIKLEVLRELKGEIRRALDTTDSDVLRLVQKRLGALESQA